MSTTMVTGEGTNPIDHNHQISVMLEYYLQTTVTTQVYSRPPLLPNTIVHGYISNIRFLAALAANSNRRIYQSKYTHPTKHKNENRMTIIGFGETFIGTTLRSYSHNFVFVGY